MDDPIVAEVRRIREEHAAKFKYDLEAIFADLQKREAESDATFMSFPAKRIKPVVKKPVTGSQHTPQQDL